MMLFRSMPSRTIATRMVRNMSRKSSKMTKRNYVYTDMRSDTLTKPSKEMLSTALTTPLGDDVFGEDPTVNKLQEMTADMFGKDDALWLPTGTMANLAAVMSHCNGRAGELICGKESHITLWEGGNISNIAGVHPRQVVEDDKGKLDLEDVRDAWRLDDDDHFAKTALICIENSHNMHGGAALDKKYIDSLGSLAEELGVGVHIDGARIFNAAVSLDTPVDKLCEGADSVSICMSKGLGAPMGSMLVGSKEFIRLAKRARKRLGGGTRQVGVVAAMGMYAIENNVNRLREDHIRAKRIATALKNNGFYQPQDGDVETNIVYFGLPDDCSLSIEEFATTMKEKYGVLVGYGYSKGGKLFRVCTHIDVDDDGVDRAIDGMISLGQRS